MLAQGMKKPNTLSIEAYANMFNFVCENLPGYDYLVSDNHIISNIADEDKTGIGTVRLRS